MSVLFGNFDLIGDILDTKYKLDLYCYLARFILIQRLTCDGIAKNWPSAESHFVVFPRYCTYSCHTWCDPRSNANTTVF